MLLTPGRGVLLTTIAPQHQVRNLSPRIPITADPAMHPMRDLESLRHVR